MKRNYLFISIGAALLLLLSASSCGNLQLPETVSVKTNARFQAPLGTAKYDITKKLSLESMRAKIQEGLGDKATIYTYAQDEKDDVLRYLIHSSIPIVPIDIGQYLDNMEFESNFDALDQTQDFTVGTEITKSKEISKSVKEITDQLTEEASFDAGSGTTVYEAEATIETNNLPKVNVQNGNDDLTFGRIYYSSGSVKVTLDRTDSNPVTPGYVLNMKAYLVPYDFNPATDEPEDEYITRSNNGNWQNIITNPTLTIPLNVEGGLPKDFMFVFKAAATGGTTGVQHTYKASASYDSLKVKRVTGLNSSGGLDLGNKDIDIDLSSAPAAFKELTFDDATITAKVDKPSGWSGVQIEFEDLAFTGPSTAITGSSITLTSSDNVNYLINDKYTAAATIYPQGEGSVKFSAKPKLTLSDATIDFGADGNANQELSGSITFSLKKIKQAKVDLAELGIKQFSLPTDGSEGSVELPTELLKYVNKIEFTEMKSNPDGSPSTTLGKGFGLKCKVTNTLPAGNDISFKIQILKNGSDGYEKTATIPAGSNNQGVDWTQNPCTLKFPAYEEGVKKYLDLTAEIQNASNFIFQNLELGKTYSFGLKVTEFAYDWDSVSLNLSGIKIEDAVDLPFDLSSVMDNFSIVGNEIKKIEIKGFPFYLYARTPSATGSLSELFKDIGMEGKLYISYQKDGEKYLDLMSENSSVKPTANKNIGFKGDIPWPSDANTLITGNASDPNNVAYYLNKDEASIGADLKDIMELMDASDIKLNYDIGLKDASTLTVYQSMMPTSDSEAAINMSVDIATVLSFDFNLTAPVSVNIMEMTNEDYNTPDPETGKLSDLLNRSEISSQSEYEKYVDLINSVGLDYKLVNKLLPGLELSIDVDDRHVEEGYSNVHPTPLVLSEGRNKIEFTRDNIKSIMTNIFHPNVTINLGRPLAEGETEITGYISNKSELKVSRSAISDKDALSANVIVYVQMNGDEPIQVWGGQQ